MRSLLIERFVSGKRAYSLKVRFNEVLPTGYSSKTYETLSSSIFVVPSAFICVYPRLLFSSHTPSSSKSSSGLRCG
jgi:hypothetical protein